jgi:NAD(P)H dehydrogenase (quinone)
MRVLVVFAHPVGGSFGAGLHKTVVESLAEAGHRVDDCDLYAEGFTPVMTEEERLTYEDLSINRKNVDGYVQRLLDAEGLVFVHPVWNFGYPAMLKGFVDRVFLPGVSFELKDGKAQPCLRNIRKYASVVTYGGTRIRAFLMGDPPRKMARRHMRVTIRPGAPVIYLAHYDMNRSTERSRADFMQKVRRTMTAF